MAPEKEANANADADAGADANANADAGLGTVEVAEIVHRAVVAAVVLGVMGLRRKAVRVTVGELAAVARAGAGAGADLVVVTDASAVDDAGLGAALDGVRAALGDGEAVALVIASPLTAVLSRQARGEALDPSREDAYALAVRWAAERSAMAPSFEAGRLGRIVDAMAERGLVLVEPEPSVALPGLARVRGLRSPRARALLSTIAMGATARPLLFVPSARAPKAGLARAKVERLVDGWVSAPTSAASTAASAELPPGESDLVRAALAVLDESAAGPTAAGPMPFKDLLRESRERWSAAARAGGGRATQSASDAPELAAALYRLAATDRVTLWLLDPAAPAWTLTPLAPPARGAPPTDR